MSSSGEEHRVIRIISSLLDEGPIHQQSFSWLLNPTTGQRLRVDAYFPKSNLVVEYDGQQHRKFMPYFHKTPQHFLDLRYRDHTKERLVQERGLLFLRVTDLEPKTAEHLARRLDGLVNLPPQLALPIF